MIENMQPGRNGEKKRALKMGPIGEFIFGKITKVGVRNVKQNQGYNKLIPSKKNYEIIDCWTVNIYEYLYCILDSSNTILHWW